MRLAPRGPNRSAHAADGVFQCRALEERIVAATLVLRHEVVSAFWPDEFRQYLGDHLGHLGLDPTGFGWLDPREAGDAMIGGQHPTGSDR